MTFAIYRRVGALLGAFFLLPASAFAASLTLSPASVNVNAGSTFTENVRVSSPDEALNAVSGNLSFPANLLQVVSISETNSIISSWVQQPAFSNNNGSVSFSGIDPNPGYTGGSTQILSIQFIAKRAGTAAILFLPSSEVLANDGNGTDILVGTSGSTVTITPLASEPAPTTSAPNVSLLPDITSSSHPDQTEWYQLTHAIFDWTNADGVTAVRLGYDQNADGTPTVLYSPAVAHKEIDLTDGIWYFHVQERGPSGWGSVGSYRVQIDTAPPLPFTVAFPNGTTTPFGSTIAAEFAATDALSGIDHYVLSINDGANITVTAEQGSAPYAVSGNPGANVLSVQAFDKAGNVTSAQGTFFVTGRPAATSTIPPGIFTFGWLALNYLSLALIALGIILLLLFGVWYGRTHFSAYRRRLHHQLGLTHSDVHKEFDILRDAITTEVLGLEKAKSRRALTREEERLVARFKKLLEQAERKIERDIEDIPK